MADFEYVTCPRCHDKFMAGEEFFRLPEGESTKAPDQRPARTS
jgi:hypothetical protein